MVNPEGKGIKTNVTAGESKGLEQVSKLVFPETRLTIEELENKYPTRKLVEGAKVTRVAPSPTGFMHFGALYASLISERLAHQSGGVFFLRIEDTDKKREIEGARKLIVDSLSQYEIFYDEGPTPEGKDKGDYGPYTQSERAEIYWVAVKRMLEEGNAYVCFASKEELEQISEEQKLEKTTPGYYGKWAIWRDKPINDVIAKINEGVPYVIRYRSSGDINKKIRFYDIFKGELDLPENNQDIVLLKSDKLPTYHLAHLVDDHFMRTTHVLRGDEWLSSLPLHLQLFRTMGWCSPKYGHLAPISKMEGNSKRKLSKRKDPEANIEFYDERGYPKEAVIEYLLGLANSGFEGWRMKNPQKSYIDYPLSMKQLIGGGGALLDESKLRDISKEVIGRMSAKEAFQRALEWSKKHNQRLATLLQRDTDYSIRIFSIERGGGQTRKDIVTWSDLNSEIGYFFEEMFEVDNNAIEELGNGSVSNEDIAAALEEMKSTYVESADKETWMGNLKLIAEKLGYAKSRKEYKENPKSYKGHIGDLAKVYRVLLVGRNQSPDLYEVMRVLGKERIKNRLRMDPLN